MSGARRFQQELAKVTGNPLTRKCHRVVELEAYLASENPRLLFDLGPKISKGGQRFSPPDDHRGLYVAADLITAGSEYADGKKRWQKGDCANFAAMRIEVQLQRVLDLTAAATRRTLGTSKAEIQSPWAGFAELNNGRWPTTWILGHETFASERFDGILFPSTKCPDGSCLLIFTERLVVGQTSVTIFKKDGSVWERLP